MELLERVVSSSVMLGCMMVYKRVPKKCVEKKEEVVQVGVTWSNDATWVPRFFVLSCSSLLNVKYDI